MMGRPPKPIQRQIAEGDPRKKGKKVLERELAASVKAGGTLPENPPPHLKGRARKAWRGWVQALDIMKLDKLPDAAALEGACIAYAAAVETSITIERDGYCVYDYTPRITEVWEGEVIVVDEGGEKIVSSARPHPLFNANFKAWSQVKAFCCEFGFTPASRARLRPDPRPDDGEEEDMDAKLNAARPSKEDPAPASSLAN